MPDFEKLDCGCKLPAIVLDNGHCSGCGAEVVPAPTTTEPDERDNVAIFATHYTLWVHRTSSPPLTEAGLAQCAAAAAIVLLDPTHPNYGYVYENGRREWLRDGGRARV